MDETFDFVIVGSGGGSMCAALLMRWAGKSVVILEKTEMVGGTTSISGALMWVPANRFMKEAGVHDSPEQAMVYLDAVVGDGDDQPGATRTRRLAYVEQSNEMLEFLISQGIKFRRNPYWPDYYDAPGASVPGRTISAQLFDINRLGDWKDKMRPFALPLPAYLDEAVRHLSNIKRSWAARGVLLKVMGRALGAKLKGQRLVTGGNAMQGRMLEAALKAGVDIRVNVAVKQIIIEDGRATGVIVEKEGAEQKVGARLGVLINAGGFARNQQMLDRYIPGMSAEWTNVAPGDTGEMIEAAASAGAALVQMDSFIGGQVTLPPGVPARAAMVQSDMCKPHSIVVDQSGERYVNESSNYTDFSRAVLDRDKQVPAIPSWMILDSQYIDTYMLVGTMAGANKPQAWFDEGFLHKAETIEELAAALGIDPAKLRTSLDRFNEFARKGDDEDFRRGASAYNKFMGDALDKKSPSLGTIEKGPFYALPVYPGDVGTFGGMLTDEHARVLREDGSVIPGLYATGTSAASVMGKVSPGAGVNVGQSFTWGYVAAKHAANLGNSAKADARAAS